MVIAGLLFNLDKKDGLFKKKYIFCTQEFAIILLNR